jgi:hypothetical protein
MTSQKKPQTPLAKIDEISDGELKQSLKSLKNRKASGPDGLNSELFKYGGPVLSNRLLKLISKCWREKSIPEEWGQARGKLLFKRANVITVRITDVSVF